MFQPKRKNLFQQSRGPLADGLLTLGTPQPLIAIVPAQQTTPPPPLSTHGEVAENHANVKPTSENLANVNGRGASASPRKRLRFADEDMRMELTGPPLPNSAEASGTDQGTSHHRAAGTGTSRHHVAQQSKNAAKKPNPTSNRILMSVLLQELCSTSSISGRLDAVIVLVDGIVPSPAAADVNNHGKHQHAAARQTRPQQQHTSKQSTHRITTTAAAGDGTRRLVEEEERKCFHSFAQHAEGLHREMSAALHHRNGADDATPPPLLLLLSCSLKDCWATAGRHSSGSSSSIIKAVDEAFEAAVSSKDSNHNRSNVSWMIHGVSTVAQCKWAIDGLSMWKQRSRRMASPTTSTTTTRMVPAAAAAVRVGCVILQVGSGGVGGELASNGATTGPSTCRMQQPLSSQLQNFVTSSSPPMEFVITIPYTSTGWV